MTLRGTLAATTLAAASMLPGLAQAGINDILIGIDEKVVIGPSGQVVGPPGKDALLVLDVSNPAKPKIRASLPLMNSLLGPPTNLQITPDGKTGVLANSVATAPDGEKWKIVMDNKLFIIDLTASPPRLTDTLTVGTQPSGLAISHKGDLILIGNRAGKSVSVVSLAGGVAKVVDEVQIGQEVAAVAIAPDGKRAFICMNVVNKVGVLSIDGTKVMYDKTLDIPSAFNPYNIDMTPDGKYVIASNTGAAGLNGDAEVTIEATGPHPHVVQIMSPGAVPEGFALSPDGKVAVAPLIEGSGSPPTAYNYVKNAEAAIMSVGPNGMLKVTGRAKLGAVPEGIAFSPKGDYVYIGNYSDRDLQTFHIEGGKLVQVDHMKLPGQPASMRGPAR